METSDIALNGGGRLHLYPEGAQVQLEAVRPNDGRGLYKVWIQGRSGRLLLGTLVPEGDILRLRRRLTRGELERSGCWPVTGGEVLLAFSFNRSGWKREDHPERLLRDGVLRGAAQGQSVLLRRREGGFCLAVPFDPLRPFPLTPLFCLAKIQRVEGKPHTVFYFDREGNPILPHNGSNTGENSGTS